MTPLLGLLDSADFTGQRIYDGGDIGRENHITESMTVGALESLGAGLISGGEVTAGVGLNVNIAAFLVVTGNEAGVWAALKTTGNTPRAIPANSTRKLFAALNLTGNILTDSRMTRKPLIPLSESDTWDGGELLATITTNSNSVTSIVMAPRASDFRSQSTLTDNYTATGLEQRLDLDNAAGKTVTLPLASAALYRKARLTIPNVGDAGTWTVALTSPDTLAGGATSISIPAGQTAEIYVAKRASGAYRWAKI